LQKTWRKKGLTPFFLIIAFGVIFSAFHLRFTAGQRMETLWPLNARHILNPDAFCFRCRLTFTTAYRNKLFFIFGDRFAFTQFQFVKGITMTFQQLRLFDGEISMTENPRG
jgi:hypothetical protein